ncbi:hypothetical protein NQ314_019050 [Rhamnusium bicolor]|uniref:Uncharacterized protein n=1 Tax=Rhamnusium bicolor TaxID=1586634 RepID=A0AAV8WQJ0_9CUCU|nr:hypothetical protein NQ314_019050 [Rhamnusium bicolor]
MFGTNSKVNNTNIHVEHIRNIQQKNPNIFSDSAEEFNSVSNVPVENIVMNAKRLRKKELSRHKAKKKHSNPSKSQSERIDNNMRSVSQQCTLDYSSETISDSILDKTSPDKNLLPNQESFMTATSEAVPSMRVIEKNKPKIERSGLNFGIIDSSLCGASTPRIYINPSHDLRSGKGDGQSRTSSISVSDLDELYQQIRRGPEPKRTRNLYGTAHASPCLSDSEINSYVSDIRQRRRASHSHENFDHLSDDVETTV